MDYPNCSRCKTDQYLNFLEVREAGVDRLEFGSGARRITKNRPRSPEVHYFCQSCGSENGHSVPMDWELPPPADITALQARGDYWLAPREHVVRQENGNWRVTQR